MPKFHIKSDGIAGLCKANERTCPYAKDSEHFFADNETQAEIIAQNRLKKKYGTINQQRSKRKQFTKVTHFKYNIGFGGSTNHLHDERKERLDKIKKLFGMGFKVNSFKVDKGHRNGEEIHEILDNGVINIYNYKTKRYITSLIARPAQISRYYEACKMHPPTNLLKLAKEHERLNYNNL